MPRKEDKNHGRGDGAEDLRGDVVMVKRGSLRNKVRERIVSVDSYADSYRGEHRRTSRNAGRGNLA
jgi:hypothetical protein